MSFLRNIQAENHRRKDPLVGKAPERDSGDVQDAGTVDNRRGMVRLGIWRQYRVSLCSFLLEEERWNCCRRHLHWTELVNR